MIRICKRILNYHTRTIDKIAPKDAVAENQSIMIHRFALRADCQSRARAMALAFFGFFDDFLAGLLFDRCGSWPVGLVWEEEFPFDVTHSGVPRES